MIEDSPREDEREVTGDSARRRAAANLQRRETANQNRGTASDPIFGFMIAAALSIGLTPLLPDNADLRYTLVWGALSGVSVLTWLLGNMERIANERPENLGWGVLYGLMLGIPIMVVLRQAILGPATARIFPDMSPGSLLAFLVFVMPLAENLFFRGLLQRQLPPWIVGILSTLWNLVLFFPVMWEDVLQFPPVTLVLVIVLLLMNMTYVYVRQRNGLAASWLCQIVANLVILYIPFL